MRSAKFLNVEVLRNWKPTRIEEIADKGCPGLVVRGGPSGVKSFIRGRTRVRIGYWPETTLAQAREALAAHREKRRAEAPGQIPTVRELAESYKLRVLDQYRDTAAQVFNIIKRHILSVIGDRPAREVEPPEIVGLVDAAKEPMEADVNGKRRTIGGSDTARVALREAKAIFAHGVGRGVLKYSPAETLKARDFGITAHKRKRRLNAQEIEALFQALDLNALLDGTAKPARLSATVRLALAFLLPAPSARTHSWGPAGTSST
jgi:Arm domain-containing DNA-binding protein